MTVPRCPDTRFFLALDRRLRDILRFEGNMSRARRSAGAILMTLAASMLFAATSTAGGARWTIPARWTEQPSRAMRVVTYTVPGAKGAEAGECGVFFFGTGRGGSIEENISRWSAQFEGNPKSKSTTIHVRGMAIHRVDISGTYLSPGGPMMQSQSPKPHYRLLGAIVEAPSGLVFFKCVGPADTVAAAEKEFEALIGSIDRAGAAV
jgi:hypothetical protein